MAGIFISCRREDSAGYAMLLRDRLRAEFGGMHPIFLDLDAIQPGDDFVGAIEKKLASSRVGGRRAHAAQRRISRRRSPGSRIATPSKSATPASITASRGSSML